MPLKHDDLYGAASAAELAAEVFENYKTYVNPPLARVMKISGSPVEVRASPLLGEHNAEVYGALGVSEERLAQLRESGVI